jgi:acylphosphatase
MAEEIECFVVGRVQGVLFRDFIQRKAKPLGIRGFVENLEDRSVHVVAQGSEGDLERLIELLHKGPFLARVARVNVTWRKPKEVFDDFKIRY